METDLSPRKPEPGVLGTRIPASVVFAIGILLFLFPFVELKCVAEGKDRSDIVNYTYGNMSYNNTGIGLALGTDWRSKFGGFGNSASLNDDLNSKKKDRKLDPNIFAIAALALGIIGFVCSLKAIKPWSYLAIVAGILAFAALIALMIDLKTEIRSRDLLEGSGSKEDDGVKFVLEFTPWYYVALASFLAASFFNYKRLRIGGTL